MGQDPGTGSATLSDPEELHAGIEETRRELGDTVAALSAKTDIKARLPEAVRHNPLVAVAVGTFLFGVVIGRLSAR